MSKKKSNDNAHHTDQEDTMTQALKADQVSNEPSIDNSDELSMAMIIEGRSEDDRKFRPSDWVERVSSVLASFGADNKLRYSEYVHPCAIEGERCLVIARGLKQHSPAVYDYVMQFAKENKLRIQEDRRSKEKSTLRDLRNDDWDYKQFEAVAS